MKTHKSKISSYSSLISIDNLFQAWLEFRKGKRQRTDLKIFERNLEDNLFDLHQSLKEKSYKHDTYTSFYVQDPKQRHIHKAQVKDRVVHHLLYKYLYEVFDKSFIYDSYSCRLGKGIHKGLFRLEKFIRSISNNYTQTHWAVKCDIKKFFANVDHRILLGLLKKQVKDSEILWLLKQVIYSFHSEFDSNKGIPLGNLTSQVFANIYMNELDQFVKRKLKIKYYSRYADDFVILATSRKSLQQSTPFLADFLKNHLNLELHPNKIILRRFDWGIDFLGYIVLPYYRVVRTKTKRRIFRKLKQKVDAPNFNQSLQSYLGYFGHANSYKLTQELKNQLWFWS